MHKIQPLVLLDEDSPLKNGKFSVTKVASKGLDYRELYIVSCGNALASLDTAIEKSKLSLSLLNAKSLNTLVTDDSQRAELIQLWVENSIIRVQSVYDRALILVNKFLDLGLANESISHNTLVCNEHIIRLGINNLLKGINKECSNYRNIRNNIIHHDRYSEEALRTLSTILIANHLSQKIGDSGIINSKEADQIVQDYLDTKKDELMVYLSKIEDKVNLLYDALIPIYEGKKVELQHKKI